MKATCRATQLPYMEGRLWKQNDAVASGHGRRKRETPGSGERLGGDALMGGRFTTESFEARERYRTRAVSG